MKIDKLSLNGLPYERVIILSYCEPLPHDGYSLDEDGWGDSEMEFERDHWENDISGEVLDAFLPEREWRDHFQYDEDGWEDALHKAWGNALADAFNAKFREIKLEWLGTDEFMCHYNDEAVCAMMQDGDLRAAFRQWCRGHRLPFGWFDDVSENGNPCGEFIDFLCERELDKDKLRGEIISSDEAELVCEYVSCDLPDEVREWLEELSEAYCDEQAAFDEKWTDYLAHAPSAKTPEGLDRLLAQKRNYWKCDYSHGVIEDWLRDAAKAAHAGRGQKMPEFLQDYCRDNYDWGDRLCS